MSNPNPTMTVEQYLALEAGSGERHEWVAGHIYAMAGGSERHELAAGLVFDLVGRNARAKGCRPFIGNRRLRTRRAYYYPDVFVSCSGASTQEETTATLVVEVLSPSTRSVDMREKAAAYVELPDLVQYLIVDPLYRAVHEVSPASTDIGAVWVEHGPGAVIATPYGDIVVDDLYDEFDRLATT